MANSWIPQRRRVPVQNHVGGYAHGVRIATRRCHPRRDRPHGRHRACHHSSVTLHQSRRAQHQTSQLCETRRPMGAGGPDHDRRTPRPTPTPRQPPRPGLRVERTTSRHVCVNGADADPRSRSRHEPTATHARRHDSTWARRLLIEVDPAVAPAVVEQAYQQARHDLGLTNTRTLSDKHAELSAFCTEREQQSWSQRFPQWNRKYPQWRYQDERNFRRDAIRGSTDSSTQAPTPAPPPSAHYGPQPTKAQTSPSRSTTPPHPEHPKP